MSSDAQLPTDSDLGSAMLSLLAALPEGKSIDPSDVPKRLLGEAGPWRACLKRTRAIAARLAADGRVAVLRHGKPVAPEELRGVIRLARGEKFGEHPLDRHEERP
jgi:hypothetical protein